MSLTVDKCGPFGRKNWDLAWRHGKHFQEGGLFRGRGIKFLFSSMASVRDKVRGEQVARGEEKRG